jgi:predicted transcriptional regulator
MLARERSIFDEADPEAEAQADADAEADVTAGRLVSHAAVKSWLLSWGKPRKIPAPKVGD